MTQAGPSLLAGNEVSHLSSLGLGLRTRFLLTALKELHIFCPKSPETCISSDSIWWKRIWGPAWAICCLQRDRGKQTGGSGSLFYPKTNVLSLSIPFRREKNTKCALIRSCFHSSVELNHILNLYVCTKQIFVFWSFITFTLSSARDAAISPWPSCQRDELPKFYRDIKISCYKDNSWFLKFIYF